MVDQITLTDANGILDRGVIMYQPYLLVRWNTLRRQG